MRVMPTLREHGRTSRVAALLLCGMLFVACGEPPPEEQVRTAIVEAAGQVRAGEIAALGEVISDAYADDRGRDKPALRDLVAIYLRGQDGLHLFTRIDEPRLNGPRRSEARVWVAAASRPIERVDQLGAFQADLLRVDLELAREDDDRWRVTRADWRTADLADFLKLSAVP